jgi:hypothetical protein
LIALLGIQPAAADTLLDAFPYPLVTVKGSDAFQEWQALRSKGGTPIILGEREEVERILDAFDPSWADVYDPLNVSLAKANAHQHPASLYEHRTTEQQFFVESLRENGSDWAEEMAETDPLAIPEEYWGAWPDIGPQTNQLISLDHWETGRPPEVVYITILPTKNAWEAPAYLRFGHWNANPPPDIHAAAFRNWAEDFGAVPVVMQSDIIEMYVTSPPTGREAASALARQHYIYCSDIVDQGVGDMSVLAAILDQGRFWYFWWD